MINPSASVNAKSLLTVEMTIAPAVGEPVKFLISEGVKLTNLKYLEDGKEVIASGVVKVIKWNYIKLPESETACVHNTKSVFMRQCQPKSLIMDCSGEFESDVREVPILAIRGCEAVTDGTTEDPVQITKPKVVRVAIDGVVDEETGAITSANVVITFDKEISEESLDSFVAATHLTITDTPIQDAALSSFEITVGEKGTVFTLAVPDELTLEKLSVGDMAVIQSEDGTDIYALAEGDIPAWEKPVIEFTVSPVSIDEAEGTVSFLVNNATDEEDPAVVILNGTDVVETVMEDALGDDGTTVVGRVGHIDISSCRLRTIGNVIKVVGPGYALETEAFDGPTVEAIDPEQVSASAGDVIRTVKTSVANGDTDDIFDQMFVQVMDNLPADQVVTGLRVNDRTYDTDDAIFFDVDGEEYSAPAVMEIDSDVYVNMLPVLNAAAEKVDVTVLASSVLSTGVNKAIEYPIEGLGAERDITALEMGATTFIGTKDGYDTKVEWKSMKNLTITRENAAAQLNLVPHIGGKPVATGQLVMVSYKEGTKHEVSMLKLLSDGILIPPKAGDGPNKEAGTTTATVKVHLLESGHVKEFDVEIRDTVRPALNVTAMGIGGDIDFDGNIKNPEIGFTLSREMDKNTIANAVLTVYGTTIANKKIGALTTNINVDQKVVTLALPDSTVLDASGIKAGTVATLTIGDETAVVDVTIPEYIPPVFRGAAITGTPDFETGAMADAKLVLTFNEVIPHNNLKVAVGELAEITVANVSGVTSADGVITIPMAGVNAKDYQSHTKLNVVVTRGNESFKAVMTKGTHYPAWETPPVLEKVEVVGTPDVDTGVITNPTIKVTLDKTTNMTGATLSIAALGITDVALTGADVVIVDNTVSVTMTETLSLAGIDDTTVSAVMTNGGYAQTFAMAKGTDYPAWVLPLKLLRVQISDDANPTSPTETVVAATITMTFNKAADLSDLTSLVIKDMTDDTNGTDVVNITLSGLSANESGVATATATNLNMGVTGTMKVTITGTDHTFNYTMETADYPKYVAP